MDLILGTAQLSRPYGALDSFRKSTRLLYPLELLAFAERSEISGFDTAPVYGEAEALLGAGQVTKPIYTKLDPGIAVEDSLRQSKSRLALDTLHCVYLHEELTADPRQSKIFQRLGVHLGDDVREIGVSIYSLEEYEIALGMPEVTVIQVPFGVLDRRFSAKRLQKGIDRGKRFLGRSIFLQGLLTTPNEAELENFPTLTPFILEFRELARSHHLSPVDAAIAFASQNRGLSGLIVGARNKVALQEIIHASKRQISSTLFSDLQSLPVPESEMVDPRKW